MSATLSGASPQSGTVSLLVRPATETLYYDADGNLTGDGLWTYEYDGENRLKRMLTSTAATSWGAPNRELVFTYDYLGRRVRKQSWLNGSLVSDRKFLYQGWTLIAELDTASNKIVRSYAWGLDLDSSVGGTGGVGGLVLETVHSDTALTAYHVCADGGGNVTALVNQGTGAIAASYEYGPFGENVRTQTFDATLQAQGQPMRFSTKFTDSETGLVYYGRRFYDPSLGRFINRDPIEEAGGENLYGFAGNNAVNGIDILGLEGTEDQGTGIANVLPDAYQPWNEGDPEGSLDFSRDQPSERAKAARIGENHRRNEILTRAPAPDGGDDYFDIYLNAAIAAGADYRIAQAPTTPSGRMTVRAPTPAEIELELMRDVSRAGKGGRNDPIEYERAQRALEAFRQANGIRPPTMPRDLEIRATGPSRALTPREQLITRVQAVIESRIQAIRAIDPNAKIGFRGSLARGAKGEHKGGGPFDPNDFDVDAFIVSDVLAKAIPANRGFRPGGANEIVRGIQSDIDATLRMIPGFEGLRGDPFTFRVFTNAEIQRLSNKPDEVQLFIGGPR